MFAQQSLRRIAARVLLLWLIALGAGVANACSGAVDMGRSLATAHTQHQAMPQHPGDPATAVAGYVHKSGQHDNAPCAKFCEELSASPQALKLQSDPLHQFGLMPALPALFNAPSEVESGPVFSAEHALPHNTVPIPIAFLRLAL